MTTQATKQASLLVYGQIHESGADELLASLGTPLVKTHTSQELLSQLENSSFNGLCCVCSTTEVEALGAVFAEIESRAMLEGLRPVLILLRSQTSMNDRPFQVYDKSWLQDLGLSAFRDIIELSRQASLPEREEALKRLMFAIQFNSKNPFANRFGASVRWKTHAQIHVAGRLSWFEEKSRMLCIECGAQLSKEQTVRIRVDGDSGILILSGLVKDNQPAELRYNFGSSCRIELTSQSAQMLRRAIVNEPMSPAFDKPMRRGFIVTRSHALRQSLSKELSKNFIDCRVPLVKRNILADLPMLAPHFVLIEDRVLKDMIEKEGPNIISDMVKAAGPQARFAIVGEEIADVILISNSFGVVRSKPSLENNLISWLGAKFTAAESADKRLWFTNATRFANVSLSFEERVHAISADGVMLRGHNQYRLWNNFEIVLPGTRVQFIGKATAALLACDAFKSKHHVTIQDHAVVTYISCLTSSADLLKETAKALETQLSAIGFETAPQRVMHTYRPAIETVIDPRRHTEVVDDTPRTPIKLPQINWKALIAPFYLILILLGVGLLIYAMLQVDHGGESFSRSFRDLFESRGR